MSKELLMVKWLDRRISAPGPFLCLCLSEAEYRSVMKKLKQEQFGHWIKTEQADATAHYLFTREGMAVVVCLSNYEKHSPIEVAGLLVHEAVHAWQQWCDFYGEKTPGCEQEAYAIQRISQELMAEFARRIAT
jgi:hypothetical protein